MRRVSTTTDETTVKTQRIASLRNEQTQRIRRNALRLYDNNPMTQTYETLAAWCKARDYAGYDPFDGLNSRIFQATPLKNSRLARLAWLQFFKRCPLNLRPLARIAPSHNAKGIALFALARLSEHRRTRTPESATEARYLLAKLLDLQLKNYAGACWGYNFDWQGRAFYAPCGVPTIVPTAFAARALVEAAQVFDNKEYLATARSVCDFILGDLHETASGADEVCWSYTPLDNTRVFNASLLAAETLGTVGALTGESELCEWARRGANYVVRRQSADGSWSYGADGYQSWADNFHTAFVLTSLTRIKTACGDDAHGSFTSALQRGYDFWTQHFFLPDGTPKYFHNKTYPIDAHATGAAVIALLELTEFDAEAITYAAHLLSWAVNNLRAADGSFHYQKHRWYTTRTPYMRWTQAWMLYALARLAESESTDERR